MIRKEKVFIGRRDVKNNKNIFFKIILLFFIVLFSSCNSFADDQNSSLKPHIPILLESIGIGAGISVAIFCFNKIKEYEKKIDYFEKPNESNKSLQKKLLAAKIGLWSGIGITAVSGILLAITTTSYIVKKLEVHHDEIIDLEKEVTEKIKDEKEEEKVTEKKDLALDDVSPEDRELRMQVLQKLKSSLEVSLEKILTNFNDKKRQYRKLSNKKLGTKQITLENFGKSFLERNLKKIIKKTRKDILKCESYKKVRKKRIEEFHKLINDLLFHVEFLCEDQIRAKCLDKNLESIDFEQTLKPFDCVLNLYKKP